MKKRLLALALLWALGAGMACPALAAGPEGFADVAPGAWYAEAVTWAVEQGIAAGTSDTTFSPDETCTAAHILTFLWRAQGSPEPVPEEQPVFYNVKGDEWYGKTALWAYDQDLVSGGEFLGYDPCIRAMAVVFLWQLAGRPEAGECPFEDVPADAAYAPAVAWAAENGIVSGLSETEFGPYEVCTRGQIVTLLHRALAVK